MGLKLYHTVVHNGTRNVWLNSSFIWKFSYLNRRRGIRICHWLLGTPFQFWSWHIWQKFWSFWVCCHFFFDPAQTADKGVHFDRNRSGRVLSSNFQCCTGTRSAFRRSGTRSNIYRNEAELVPDFARNGTENPELVPNFVERNGTRSKKIGTEYNKGNFWHQFSAVAWLERG